MGNTLGTTNATVIAQRALETLLAKLPVLKQIVTDFSDQGARFGEAVITHIVTAASAVDFNSAVGYVPSDRTQTDVSVTLNKHKHHTYYVGVNEASASRIDLIERFAATAAYSVGAALVSDLCALVTNANFSNKTTKALGAGLDGFDRKTVIQVGSALSGRKVPSMDRFMLLNSSYYASLCMDNTMLTTLLQTGAASVQSGVLPNVHGFAVSEFVDLPANAENLCGFAGTRDSLVLVTRIPDDPGEGNSNCQITVVRDEASGLAIQVREWYEPTLAQFRRTYTLMYGVAKGQADSLQRIVSA
jgi:hypothetical protein